MSGLIQLYTHFTPFTQGVLISEIRHFEDINSYKELAEFFSNFFLMPHGCDTRWVSQENMKKTKRQHFGMGIFAFQNASPFVEEKLCLVTYPQDTGELFLPRTRALSK
jgi:hypothetical protein